jgi:hypothetical protein
MIDRDSNSQALLLAEPPDGLQIRVFGAKGVLVHIPGTLGIGLRPSQIKFVSRSPVLEIVTVAKAETKSNPLIRQFIYLLESLGVQPGVFVQLHAQSYRQRIQAALSPQTTPAKCVKRLEAFCREISGIEGRKIRISLPQGGGANLLLMGVVDEHDCLEPREVLVNDGCGYMEPMRVLVGRSPAYHPGDLQILTAVPKPAKMVALGVTRRGCLVFSAKGRRPVFDGMGQGDVDGDKYYVLSEKRLFPPASGDSDALDYGSQLMARPTHDPSPCQPAVGHGDADLQAAFAMMERCGVRCVLLASVLTETYLCNVCSYQYWDTTDAGRLVTPGQGGALALPRVVTEWMVTCDQLGATSNAARNLVNLALDSHGVSALHLATPPLPVNAPLSLFSHPLNSVSWWQVRAMALEDLESFESQWVEAVQLSGRSRPDYFQSSGQPSDIDEPAGGAAAAASISARTPATNSVVGLLSRLTQTVVSVLLIALGQLRQNQVHHRHIY